MYFECSLYEIYEDDMIASRKATTSVPRRASAAKTRYTSKLKTAYTWHPYNNIQSFSHISLLFLPLEPIICHNRPWAASISFD